MTRAMTVPVPVGSLDNYIQAVSRFPILSPEEELRFARKFRAEDDVEAAR
ncbi:MAG TPA: sigma-70 factor domain-containing protein, partial [Burkholderiales bacterium]